VGAARVCGARRGRKLGHCSIRRMRKQLTWLAGVIGLAWLVALLRRHRPAPVWTAGEDRAEALRRTLQESRAAPEHASVEPEPAAEPPDLAARRDEVHDRGRAALDEMDSPSSE
jgi:hypothetical protein